MCRDSICTQYSPETMDAVESLVSKVYAHFSLPFRALVNDASESEKLVCTSSSFLDMFLFNILSTAVEIHLLMILQNAFLGTDSKLMSRQLLQLVRLPFLG